MALYVGVNGQAKLVSKAYIGVNGQAKAIANAYIGVDGQAKTIMGPMTAPFTAFAIGPSTVYKATGPIETNASWSSMATGTTYTDICYVPYFDRFYLTGTYTGGNFYGISYIQGPSYNTITNIPNTGFTYTIATNTSFYGIIHTGGSGSNIYNPIAVACGNYYGCVYHLLNTGIWHRVSIDTVSSTAMARLSYADNANGSGYNVVACGRYDIYNEPKMYISSYSSGSWTSNYYTAPYSNSFSAQDIVVAVNNDNDEIRLAARSLTSSYGSRVYNINFNGTANSYIVNAVNTSIADASCIAFYNNNYYLGSTTSSGVRLDLVNSAMSLISNYSTSFPTRFIRNKAGHKGIIIGRNNTSSGSLQMLITDNFTTWTYYNISNVTANQYTNIASNYDNIV